MPHDNTLSILISGEGIFHFMQTDGNGKVTHSPHYRTDNEDMLYEFQTFLGDLDEMTKDAATKLKARIRRSLAVTKY